MALWKRKNLDEQGIVKRTPKYADPLKRERPILRDILRHEDLWAHLIKYDVLTNETKDRIKLSGVRHDIIDGLLDHIESGPVWKLHALFRACTLTKQDHVIRCVGFSPDKYSLVPSPPALDTEDASPPDKHKAYPKQPCTTPQRKGNDFRRGLRIPTLTKYIKSILDRYPDDGQILKELIQNADDAGATTVKFLMDDRHHNSSPEGLVHPEMTQFQGPALLVYNDAVFTEDDWGGICMMEDSNKEKDVVKTGRFGLGFKSIFHITDLPIIASGDYVGIIDPHHKYLPCRESAYNWHLVDDKDFLQNKEEQFRPLLQGVFGSETSILSNADRYNHTAFRFPLRREANCLSGNIYTAERVLQLFQSLKHDDGQSLLFLKSVQCIEFYRQTEGSSEPKILYQMKIADNKSKQVSKTRHEFLNKIHQGQWKYEPAEAILQMTVQTEDFQTDHKSLTSNDWLVYHTCRGGEAVVGAADELDVLPWVGIALPLSTSVDLNDQDREPAGQLFATLPLPLDRTEKTGFAFHVHAYFAMEQNRRHLKWPTLDQTEEDLNSAPLQWNQRLVNECIPATVAAFFRQAIKITGSEFPPNNMYKLMPDEDRVDPKWMPAVSYIYKELFTEQCLYVPARYKGRVKVDKEIFEAGGWLKTCEVIQCDDNLPDQIKHILKRIVTNAGYAVTEEPPHVKAAVKKHSQKQPNTLSPKDVKNALLQVIINGEKLGKDDALTLLQYFLDSGQPEDLIHLPLLPLLSGDMTSFQEAKESPIFLPSKEHPAALLPGLEHRLVDMELPDHLLSPLHKLSLTGKTQLKLLTLQDVLENLPDVLPSSWADLDVVSWSPEDTSHPSLTWLEKVWDYIHLNRPGDQEWKLLDNLHLLPVDNNKKLCKFSVGNIILGKTEENLLPKGVVRFLSSIGCIILEEYADFVYRHNELLYHAVHLPTCQGIADALISVSHQLGDTFIEKIKASRSGERTYLNDFLSYMSDSGIRLVSSKSKEFLLGLPLFLTVSGSGFESSRHVSLTEVSLSGPSLQLPVPFPVPVIDVPNEKVKYMLEALGVCEHHQDQFPHLVKQTLLPAMKNKRYTNDQVEKLICYIMDHHPKVIIENIDIAGEMADLAFLKGSQGKWHLPENLYDPRDKLLASLLGREFFPHQMYYTENRLSCLEKLGMRPLTQISSEDFLSIPRTLQTEPGKVDDFIQITESLVEQAPDGKWWEKLKDVAFLHAIHTKPYGYPNNLPWRGSAEELLAPKDVCHIKFGKQAGSTVPLVDLDETTLQDLQAKVTPSLDDLIIHLKHIVEHYDEKEENSYLSALDEVYNSLAYFGTKEIQDSLDQHSVSKWIWSRSGFKHRGQVLLQKPEIDLAPFYYGLPQELEKHNDLLNRCGVPPTVPFEKVLDEIAEEHLEHKTKSESITAHDLDLAIKILEVLCRTDAKTALVPVQTNDNTKLCFKPAVECTVWDHSSELDDDLSYVHPQVPKGVIDHFSIPTVVHRSLDSEELDIDFESFGQHEPLTKRLCSILEGYTDGLAVMKEMIQNADDAGATEVRLVYDMRENKEWRKSLLDPNMADWQGPAMWIYNNAVFTDEDFKNITKLAGETKADKTDRIGRFGLGFNAVYNLTDVPSILSRDTLVMFDPHTTYLERAVRDKTKPGLKINIGKQRGKLFSKYPDQFAPWNGVLGCNLDGASDNRSFNGTLFRLPLRGYEQSKTSEISNIFYDKRNVDELLKMIHNKGSSLLLFTQSVLRVSVSVIENKENDTDLQMKDIFNIYKEPVEYLSQHGINCDMSIPAKAEPEPTQKLINESSILKASVKNTSGNNTRKDVRSSMIIKTVVKTFREGRHILGEKVNGSDTNTLWIVSQSIENMPSAQEVSVKQQGVGGIAICLEKKGDKYKIKQQDDLTEASKGSYFSFLPLPVKSPLPFHINGTFDLDPSRRYLLLRTDHDKTLPAGEEWNKCLMKGPVCTAYINALSDIISITSPDEDVMGILPVNIKEDLITSMSEMFWQRIIEDSEKLVQELEIFLYPKGKVSMRNTYFLDQSFAESCQDIKSKIVDVITTVFHTSGKHLVNLPDCLEQTLRQVNSEMMMARMITEELFLTDFFLPNIASLPLDEGYRDALLVKALKSASYNVESTLESTACIPVSLDGKHMAQPNDLVHPKGKAADLYTEKDFRFPVITCDGDKERNRVYDKLCNLGMIRDHLSWKDILERSGNLKRLGPSNNKKLVTDFLAYLDWKLKENKENDEIPDGIKQALQMERFLYAQQRRLGWVLTWNGEEFPSYSGSEIYDIRDTLLACTQLPILHYEIHNEISPNVAVFLGINKPVSIQTVKMQVQEITSNEESIKNNLVLESLHNIYKYLNNVCTNKKKAEIVQQEFSNQRVLLVEDNEDRRLVSAAVCAFNPDFTAFPYLNKLSRQYELFYRQVGIAEHLSCNNFIASLCMIQEEKGRSPLDEETLFTVKRLLVELCKHMTKDHKRVADLGTTIYIPDTESILKPAEDLCHNDCPQLQTGLMYPLVNKCITNDVASLLGVKGLRSRALSERSHGIHYANRIDLQQCIHSVLESYPCSSQIMMELLQQADDAGATEIHFKLDPQKHNTTTVFDEGWKTMQGPSLCVENDAKLYQDDLAGLFLPGNESTNSSLNQVGSGIQSVYHITDTPIVLATLDDGTERLCAYDPTCQYVKGTSPQKPGMMYEDVPLLRQLFPDVFECFQERGFGYPSGTQFRFPLRDPEAAKGSPICQSPGTAYEDVDYMLKNLTEESYRALLFMKSLKKIIVTRYDTTQSKFETQVITSTITENESEIKDFIQHIEVQRQERTATNSIYNFKKAVYGLRLNKTNKEEENWSVVQHYGHEGTYEGEKDPVLEYQNVQKLPIGGVAVLKDVTNYDRSFHSPALDLKSTERDAKSVGNLLFPSHQRTHLPVQVSGSFQNVPQAKQNHSPNVALDNGWNKYISEIIARAYLDLIESNMEVIKSDTNSRKSSVMTSCRQIEQHFKIFPAGQESSTSGTEAIVTRLYELMTDKAILPEELELATGMKWATPAEACFPSAQEWTHGDVTIGANLCGLKVVRCPFPVQKMIDTFCCKLQYLSARVLLKFLGDRQRCNYKQLSEFEYDTNHYKRKRGNEVVHKGRTEKLTPQNRVVMDMITFCQADQTFNEQLDQIPLLVTSDGVLRTFDLNNPVYKTPDMKILKPTTAKFLHPDFIEVFKDVRSPVFKDLDIEGFCEELTTNFPKLAKNLVIDFQGSMIEQSWLEDVWRCIDSITTETDTELVKEHGGHLSLWLTYRPALHLYPINDIDKVFQKRHNRNYLHSEICQAGIPVSASEGKVADRIAASFEKPKSVLHALHHYQQEQGSVGEAKVFQDRKLLEYLAQHHDELKDKGDLIKDLPIFETVTGEYVPLTGNRAYVIPSKVPTEDMDVWTKTQDGILFLKEKSDFGDMYNQLGCIFLGAEEVYIEHIFKELEHLTEHGHEVHIHYVLDNLVHQERGHNAEVLDAIRNLDCVRRVANTYCKPCDLYDPNIPLFEHMQKEDLPAEDLSTVARLDVLRMAGMTCTATKEMLVIYSKRPPENSSTQLILDYIEEYVDTHEQPEYLQSLSDIPFIPRCKSGNRSICPDGSEERFVPLRGSVLVTNSNLAWAVAPLIENLQLTFSKNALAEAGVIINLPCQLVARNIVTVCGHCKAEQPLSLDKRIKLSSCIDTCYNYITSKLQNEELTEQDMKNLQEIMSDQFCVPVDQAKQFVKPNQTVLELKPHEEAKGYLYRLPDNLIYSKDFLGLLGLADKPTAGTYQRVLRLIHDKFGSHVINNDEDIHVAKLATRQVFRMIKDTLLDIDSSLWLLSKRNCLYKSHTITYSNNRRMERALTVTVDINLLVGVNLKVNVETILPFFPETHRPMLLTAIVKEEVQHKGHRSTRSSDEVKEHLASGAMVQGLKRLTYHIMVTNSQGDIDDVIEEKIAWVQNLLQNIQLLSVENLKTCLKSDTGIIGDWQERKFFAERDTSTFYVDASTLEVCSGQVYMYSVLADMVNQLSNGLFRENMRVLMVLLSSDPKHIGEMLDEMEILPYPH